MPHETARPAALLALLLTLLVRGLPPSPADLGAAGGLGLAVFGALTLGRPLLTRLLSLPPDDSRV